MSDNPNTTEKPWAKNRNGDTRQLLHEAEQLDVMVRLRRADAARLRAQAAAVDEGADHMEEAARDYRAWARERANGQ